MTNAKAVFVIDDDPSVLQGLQRLLKAHGFSAELFESAEEVLQRGHFEEAFCIVLDINLNGESGIELRRTMSDRGVNLPVVFITANDDDGVRNEAIDSGCIAYLTKPFTAKALVEPIEEAAARSRCW